MRVSPGPTPLFPLGGDPRSFSLGLDAAVNPSFVGFFDAGGVYQPPTIPVPFSTNLQDVPLYFQGFTFPGTTYFVGEISNPAVVWFGMANTFRNRSKDLSTERAFSFGETLPEAALEGAIEAFAGCDVALVIGTSGVGKSSLLTISVIYLFLLPLPFPFHIFRMGRGGMSFFE